MASIGPDIYDNKMNYSPTIPLQQTPAKISKTSQPDLAAKVEKQQQIIDQLICRLEDLEDHIY